MAKYATKYMTCPICDAEIAVGDEKVGEEICCPYCQSPLKLRKNKETDELYLREDF